MSEATAGVAQANASARTSPKLSPPSAGVHGRPSRVENSSRPHLVRDDAEHVDARLVEAEAARAAAGTAAGRCRSAAAARRFAVDLGPGPQQGRQAFARVVPADEDDVVGRGLPGSASVGDQHAVRDDAVVAGMPARGGLAPPSARPRSARRSGRSGSPRSAGRRAASRDRRARATWRRSGSGRTRAWRRRSRASSARAGGGRRIARRRSARRMRAIERGESTMFGSEPFAGTTTERPTGMIPVGQLAVPAACGDAATE